MFEFKSEAKTQEARDKEFALVCFDMLMTISPDGIGESAKLVKRLAVERMVPLLGADVKHVTAALQMPTSGPQAGEVACSILVPFGYGSRGKIDIGEVEVFARTTAQVRDFYNGKWAGPDDQINTARRSQVYAAEAALKWREWWAAFGHGIVFRDTTLKVLKTYPRGLDSMPESLRYESREFQIGPRHPLADAAAILFPGQAETTPL